MLCGNIVFCLNYLLKYTNNSNKAELRGGNPKRTVAKIDKIELGIDSYGKNINTLFGIIRIDQNILYKFAIQNVWFI